jgi:GT2 family glycosyltransferase
MESIIKGAKHAWATIKEGIRHTLNFLDLLRDDIDANWTIWPWNYAVASFPTTMPSGRPWPKFSIVTVSYNQGDYIEATIRSVLMQGYPNLEYIVVDGNSTDGTKQILDRYRNELSVCLSEADDGQSQAINKGFSYATGEILAWLNSDDQYLPDTLRSVALAFDANQIDLVVGGCQCIKNHARVRHGRVHHCALPLDRVANLPFDRIVDFVGCWQRGDFFLQPEVFWSKKLWDIAGGHVDESLRFAMDYELWLRMAKAGAKALRIDKTLATFRIHDRQKTIFNPDVSIYPEYIEVARQYRVGIRP